ncbi:MAG: hypothetical protein WBO36_16105, partial [Saprospiraceae bacterium]
MRKFLILLFIANLGISSSLISQSTKKKDINHTPIESILHTRDNTPPKGFISLFDGKSLKNWKGVLLEPNDKPHKRAELSSELLQSLQNKADSVMEAHWSVTDLGELHF